MDRAGSLPVNAMINLCFSGLTKQEVKKLLGSEAGAYSYVGTKEFREVERRAFEENDPDCRMVFDAMAYQLAKDIGAMAAVLKFQRRHCSHRRHGLFRPVHPFAITDYVGNLAPVLRLPGEEEMRSLAEGALRVLHGEQAKVYP